MLPLFIILALGLLWSSVYGPANRSNANGTASGVLALLAIAKALPHNKRVCLVFLDNNERNLLGASAFRKKHPGAASNSLFFNFDCVGDGEHLLLMPSKLSRWDESLLSALNKAFSDEGTVHAKVLTQGLFTILLIIENSSFMWRFVPAGAWRVWQIIFPACEPSGIRYFHWIILLLLQKESGGLCLYIWRKHRENNLAAIDKPCFSRYNAS